MFIALPPCCCGLISFLFFYLYSMATVKRQTGKRGRSRVWCAAKVSSWSWGDLFSDIYGNIPAFLTPIDNERNVSKKGPWRVQFGSKEDGSALNLSSDNTWWGKINPTYRKSLQWTQICADYVFLSYSSVSVCGVLYMCVHRRSVLWLTYQEESAIPQRFSLLHTASRWT